MRLASIPDNDEIYLRARRARMDSICSGLAIKYDRNDGGRALAAFRWMSLPGFRVSAGAMMFEVLSQLAGSKQ